LIFFAILSSYDLFDSATIKRRFLRCSVVKSSCSSFIQQEEQMKVVSVFQIQMHVPIAAALAFSSGRVLCSSLAYSAQPLSDITLFGIPEQVLLYLAQDLGGGRTR
jgi:hypothetical protein